MKNSVYRYSGREISQFVLCQWLLTISINKLWVFCLLIFVSGCADWEPVPRFIRYANSQTRVVVEFWKANNGSGSKWSDIYLPKSKVLTVDGVDIEKYLTKKQIRTGIFHYVGPDWKKAERKYPDNFYQEMYVVAHSGAPF